MFDRSKQPVIIARNDHDVRTLLGKLPPHGKAHAARAAGDDYGLLKMLIL